MSKTGFNEEETKSQQALQIPGLFELLSKQNPPINENRINNSTNNTVINYVFTQPQIYLLFGPSGSGKTSYCKELLKRCLQA